MQAIINCNNCAYPLEIYFILNALKTVVYFIALRKTGCLTGGADDVNWKENALYIIKQSLPYYYLNLLTLVSNQIPILFLEYRSGVEQVGFFNIANKILTPMNLILNTALIALFPNLSKIFISDNQLFVKRVKHIFVIISLLGIVGAFAVTFFRTEAISIIYGKKYISSVLVLSYQCWYMALYSLVCLIGTLLGAIDRQKELGYLSIVSTVIQVPILWVGSKYGAEYLSAAFLVATIIGFVIHAFVINNFLKHSLKFSFFVKIFLGFVVAYIISILIPGQLNFLIKCVLFIFIMTAALYVLYNKYKGVKT